MGDLGTIITGNTPPRSRPELYGSHTPFVKATDISENEKYTYNPEEGYSEEGYKKYIKSLVPKGSTCVVTIGSIGKKMTMAHCDLFINQAMNAIIPFPNFDKDYVYYAVRNVLSNIKALDSGTASGRENVSKSAFSRMEVIIDDDLLIQKRIATALSRYDSLIDNYQKQIKLLEEAAQRLYKEWFINLRFPGHENTKIVDGVPEGWEKKSVGDMLRRMERTKQIPSNEYLKRGEIPVIDQSRNFVAGYTNDEDSRLKVTTPVILFGDHTRVLKYLSFSFARGADGTQLIMSNDIDRLPQSLFYNALVEKDLSNYSYARHFKYLKAEQILVPTKEIAQKFDTFAAKIYEQIQSCRHQLRLLTESRDRLLPKLLSGEIEV